MKTAAQRQSIATPVANVAFRAAMAVAVVFFASLVSAHSETESNISVCRAGIPRGGVVSSRHVHVRLNNGALQTSPDGRTWTECALAIRTFIRAVAYGDGRFVAVGGSYFDEPGVILTSRDGVAWVRQHRRNKQNLYSIAFGNGLFVAVGDAGTILTSADGVAWNSRHSCAGKILLASSSFGNGTFVAGGESGTILASTNGTQWKRISLRSALFVSRIDFQNGSFAAPTADGTFVSVDGANWELLLPTMTTTSD